MNGTFLLTDAIFSSFPFEVTLIPWSDNVAITMFDVKAINTEDAIKSYIDSRIVRIYGGPLCTDSLISTKKRMQRLFRRKLEDNNKTWIYGATAEFFSHLLLNHCGYRQEFLFKNLEEGSIKKGFDGLYSIDNEIWLMESKSGEGTAKANHYTKFCEAWRDLDHKLQDTSGNDPWENALHHAGCECVASSDSIRARIRKLSDAFIDDIGEDISTFNAIPCATIYYDNEQILLTRDVLVTKIKNYLKNKKHTFVHVVCISYASYCGFLEYLDLNKGKYV